MPRASPVIKCLCASQHPDENPDQADAQVPTPVQIPDVEAEDCVCKRRQNSHPAQIVVVVVPQLPVCHLSYLDICELPAHQISGTPEIQIKYLKNLPLVSTLAHFWYCVRVCKEQLEHTSDSCVLKQHGAMQRGLCSNGIFRAPVLSVLQRLPLGILCCQLNTQTAGVQVTDPLISCSRFN